MSEISIKENDVVRIVKEIKVLGINLKERKFRVYKIFENESIYANPLEKDPQITEQVMIEFLKGDYELDPKKEQDD